MTFALVIYLINMLDALAISAAIITGIGCIYLAVNLLRYVDANTVYHDKEKHEKAVANLKNWRFVAIIGLIGCFIPSERVSYTMLAAYGAENLLSSARMQGIADNSLKLIEQTIGKYLDENKQEDK